MSTPGGDDDTRVPTIVVAGDAAQPELLVRRVRLLATAGADAGRSFAAAGDRLVIGSHEKCDVVLRDPTVSRFHCEIAVDAGAIRITDLGSSNGTLVNGVRIDRAQLDDGARIALGHAVLRCDLGLERVRVPLSAASSFGRLVGGSIASRQMFARLEQAAAQETTVLLLGETGTGKEAAALALHEQGPRKDGPFVVVDCASIPANLLESELFGHQRGAFTGALADRQGAFDAAGGGTVFLDELGELPLALQPKLLRVLEARQVKPVGARAYHAVDVRVVAATHRDLARAAAAGQFRSDLYYRLAVLEVRIPPLRERLEDLPAIVSALLDEIAADPAGRATLEEPAFLAQLAHHSWPGNVRELRNYLERALAFGGEAEPPGGTAEADLAALIDASLPLRVAREQWAAQLERLYLARLLERCEGNVSAAARAAGMDRSHFHRLMVRRGVR